MFRSNFQNRANQGVQPKQEKVSGLSDPKLAVGARTVRDLIAQSKIESTKRLRRHQAAVLLSDPVTQREIEINTDEDFARLRGLDSEMVLEGHYYPRGLDEESQDGEPKKADTFLGTAWRTKLPSGETSHWPMPRRTSIMQLPPHMKNQR